MHRFLRYLSITLIPLLLSGCLGSLWTGASLVYDRHHLYKTMNDYVLGHYARQSLFFDKALKKPGVILDLVIFNGDVLMAGHVPSETLKALAIQRIRQLDHYRRLFIQVAVANMPSHALEDSWITTKINTQMLSDSSIDLHLFKIATVDNIVYILGDAKAAEAHHVIRIASQTDGVKRVVTLMKEYVLKQ